MLRIGQILGSRFELALSKRIIQFEQSQSLDTVNISAGDLAKRRFKISTVGGVELMIALPPHQKLFDGAVLFLDEERAIVARAVVRRWLRLEPCSISDAIEVGYHAGDLRWRVRLEGEVLLVALEGRPEDYTARLADLISTRRVRARVLEDGPAMTDDPPADSGE